jgi:putative endonuclease
MPRISLSGKLGESLAADYLTAKGYRVVCKNYRFGRYELDLICRQEETLVFVEVKARSSARFGYPEQFITARQAAFLRAAAESYIFKINWQAAVRFDVVAILLNEEGVPEIRHFEDAL